MRKRAPAGVIVEDAQPEAQHIWGLGAPAVDGRATTTAECAEDPGRGFELTDQVVAGEKPPVLPSDIGVGSEGRAAGFSASRAVAVDDRPDLTRHFDSNPTAQAIGVHAPCLHLLYLTSFTCCPLTSSDDLRVPIGREEGEPLRQD